MELRDLEYFLVVVETGSFSRAARQIGRSQQGLSKALTRLEESLGEPLLERSVKGIRPTPLGLLLVERARTMLAEAARFHREVEVSRSRSSGHLTIGISPIAATGIGPSAILKFRSLFPNIRLVVEAGLEAHFNRMLQSGEIDLAVASSFEGEDRAIQAEQIGEEIWVVAGRRHHPLLAPVGDLSAVAGAEWIYGRVDPKLQQAIDQSFDAAGVQPPRPAIITSSLLLATRLIADTDILTILPRSIVERSPDLHSGDLSGGRWRTPIVILRRRQAARSLLETRMIHLLREAMPVKQPTAVDLDKQL